MTPKLSKTRAEALCAIAWGHYHYGSFLTGRRTRIGTVRRLVDDGLVESVGYVMPCDDDGFVLWARREREGFRLTPLGVRVAATDLGSGYASEILSRGNSNTRHYIDRGRSAQSAREQRQADDQARRQLLGIESEGE